MTKNNTFFAFILFLGFCSPNISIFAQANKTVYSYLWFDEIIGIENTGLLNGVEYIEQHRVINEKHKFFGSDQFSKGSVVYDNQPYFDIPMKYNVFDDVLIVRLHVSTGDAAFQLLKNKIKNFTINNHNFTNIVFEESKNNEILGFYEILLKNEYFCLLKKYNKKERKYLDRDFLYFEFEIGEPTYVFSYNGSYHLLGSKRDLFRIFPELKKEIRKHYRTYKALLKTEKDTFMIHFFGDLTSTLRNKSI